MKITRFVRMQLLIFSIVTVISLVVMAVFYIRIPQMFGIGSYRVNLTMLAVTFASYLGAGIVTRGMLPAFAVALPAMLLPSLWGGRLYHRISDRAFRLVVLGLLTLAGLAMLAASLPRL